MMLFSVDLMNKTLKYAIPLTLVEVKCMNILHIWRGASLPRACSLLPLW